MKKGKLLLLITSILGFFSLAGCNNSVIEPTVSGTKSTNPAAASSTNPSKESSSDMEKDQPIQRFDIFLITDGVKYSYDSGDKMYIVAGATNVTNDLVIPGEINGIAVKKIDNYAFYNCEGLKSVIIPSSIEKIPSGAFSNCKSLTSVIIEGNVTIGNEAFANCEKLESIVFKQNVTSIGDGAFYNCAKLTKIESLPGLTNLGDYVFSKCSQLVSIIIPNTLNSCGKDIFTGCKILSDVYNLSNTTVTLSTDNITSSVHESLDELPNSTIDSNGFVFIKEEDKYYLVGNTSNQNKIIIPSSFEYNGNTITDYEIKKLDLNNVDDLYIPNSIKKFLNSAFYNSKGIKNIYYDGSISDWCELDFESSSSNPMIAADNFYYKDNDVYKSLNELIIPEIKTIKKYTFNGFSRIRKITIPASVEKIEYGAFNNCINVYEIINDSNAEINYNNFNYSIPKTIDGVIKTTINDYVFNKIEDKWYLVNYVGKDTELVLPTEFTYQDEKVDSYIIENAAFANASFVTSIEIPSNALYKNGALYGTSSLERLVVPYINVNFGSIFGDVKYENSVPITQSISFNTISGSSYGMFYLPKRLTDLTVLSPGNIDGLNNFYTLTKLTIMGGDPIANLIGCYRLREVYSTGNQLYINSINPVFHKSYDEDTNLIYDGDYVFSLIDGKYKLVSYLGNVEDVILPTTIASKEVDYEIGEYAFVLNDSIKRVFTNNHINKINAAAFLQCENLSYIYLDDSITEIGFAAFTSTALKKVVLPKDLKSIESEVFTGCTYLLDIVLPKGLKTIKTAAFYYCYNLPSITLPTSLEVIEKDAFKNCYRLAQVENYSSLNITSTDESCIGKYANITIMSNANIREDYYLSPVYYDDNGFVLLSYNSKEYAYINYVGNKNELILPERTLLPTGKTRNEYVEANMFIISSYAFANINRIISVYIPDSVSVIKQGAFYGNDNILSIRIPFIGRTKNSSEDFAYFFEADYYDYSRVEDKEDAIPQYLREITIGEGVTTISEASFVGCSEVSKLNLPSTIKNATIKEMANLSEIHIASTYDNFINNMNIIYNGIHKYDLYLLDDTLQNESKLEEIVIPNTFTIIDSRKFYGHNYIKSVTIPSSVTSIGFSAFENCTRLATITFLGETLKEIRNRAFYNCALSSVDLPNTLETIGEFAFANNKLSSFIISENVKSIGNGTLVNNNIKELTISNFDILIKEEPSVENINLFRAYNPSLGKFDGEEPNLLTKLTVGGTKLNNFALFGLSNAKEVEILNGVKEISDSCFSNMIKLEKITIADSVNSIGDRAFSGCKELTNVKLPNSLQAISNSLFYNCTKLNEVIIPNSVNSIGDSAFYQCESLFELVIPESVTEIGDYAFTGCNHLYKLTILSKRLSTNVHSFDVLLEVYNLSSIQIKKLIYSRSLLKTHADITEESILGNKKLVSNDYNGISYIGNEDNPYLVLYDGKIDTNDFIINPNTKIIFNLEYTKDDKGEIVIPKTVDYVISLKNFSKITMENKLISSPGKITESSVEIIKAPMSIIHNIDKSFLKEVTITYGEIENAEFRLCKNLEKVIIEESTDILEENAFDRCENLKYVEIKSDIKNIGSSAFRECSSLETIIVGDALETIGEYAFEECIKLKNIQIPSTIKSIGSSAFALCDSIIYNNDGDLSYLGNTSNPYLVLMTANNKNITNATINNTCKIIYWASLASLAYLKKTIIPNSIVEIGKAVFDNCVSLEEVILPNNIDSIPESMFSGCKKLWNIVLPSSVKTIKAGSFKNCSSLYSIILPQGLSSIENNAFYECYALVEIYNLANLNIVKGSSDNGMVGYYAYAIHNSMNEDSIIAKDNNGNVFAKSNNGWYLIINISDDLIISLPESFEYNGITVNQYKIAMYVFYGRKLLKLIIPNSVTSIERYAFSFVYELYKPSTLSLDNFSSSNVTIIHNNYNDQSNIVIDDLGYIFAYYKDKAELIGNINNVTDVVAPNNFNYYGTIINSYEYNYSLLYNDTKAINSVVLPTSVISIRSSSSSSKYDLYYNGTIADWCNISIFNSDSNPLNYAKNFYILDDNGDVLHNGLKYSVLTDIVIPNTVTKIGIAQFSGYKQLTSITIPESVTFIGYDAFTNCDNLQYTEYDNALYLGNESNKYLWLMGTKSTDITSCLINPNCKFIGPVAFYLCHKLESIELNEGIIGISDDAFYHCSSLTSMVVPESVIYFGGGVFAWSGLKSITFNCQLNTIPGSTFSLCPLESFVIPSSVTTLDKGAFSRTMNLKVIVIPEGVTTIGEECFYDSGVVDVSLPKSLTKIGKKAFYYCSDLKEIKYNGSMEEWNNITKELDWDYYSIKKVICSDGEISL